MIVWLLAAALVALLSGGAAADGTHDGPEPLGGAGSVRVQGYWVELLSHPAPLAAGQPGHLVVKLSSGPSRAPVSGARVLVGFDATGASSHAHAGHVQGGELADAAEVTWAGQYELALTPEERGAHRAHVVVSAIDGQRLASPLVVDFPVSVEPPPGMGPAAWSVLALVGGIALLGVYAVRVRAGLGTAGAEPLNLLDIPWLRRLLTAPGFQLSLQLPLLLLMGVVVFLGFHDVPKGGVNLATKLTWTIWWAGVIFTFFLFGRVWCTACPFGALNEWMSRLTASARRLPRPFRNLWWATAMFVLLTWADEQLGVVRSPAVTAWIVLFVAVFAVGVGLFFERRSFCRYLCPIGGVIGLYSMTAPLELRVKDTGVCRTHRDKECHRGGAASRGCPMLEFPQVMDRNNYCTLCAECAKGCSRDNVALRTRPFGKDLWATGRRALDESYLALILVGLTLLVTAQMLPAWSRFAEAVAAWLPASVRGALTPLAYLGLVESAVLLGGALVLVPLLGLAAAALADRRAGAARLGVRRAFVLFGYMFVPVALAMHLAHNLSHLLIEGGGIVPAVQRAVALYTPLSLGEPRWPAPPLAPEAVVGFLQMSVLVGFFALSLLTGHRLCLAAYADPRAAGRALVPMVVLSLLFTAAGIVLLNQPMGMRHGM